MFDAFEYFEVTAEQIVERDDRVLVLARWRARGKESGAEVEFASVEEYEIRDGLLFRRHAREATPETMERYGLAG